MNADAFDLSAVNWALLTKRLVAAATGWFAHERCFGDEAVLPATGKSAKELVFDALCDFIQGNIDWRPKSNATANDELFFLLKRVVRNDFLDLVKTGRAYKRTDVLDTHPSEDASDGQERTPTIEDLAAPSDNGFDELGEAFVLRRIAPLLEGEPDLRSFVDAVLRDGCTKREDIAVSLGVSPEEVSRRQRRLRVELASWKRGIDNAKASETRCS